MFRIQVHYIPAQFLWVELISIHPLCIPNHSSAYNSIDRPVTVCSNTWLSGRVTLTVFSLSSLDVIWSERRLEPEFERYSIGGRRLVAPRPASRLFSSDGLRAQMKAWNEETVNTPNLFNVFFVARDTWVRRLWNRNTSHKVKWALPTHLMCPLQQKTLKQKHVL